MGMGESGNSDGDATGWVRVATVIGMGESGDSDGMGESGDSDGDGDEWRQ